MTVGEFIDVASNNPLLLIVFFSCIPFVALLAWLFGRGEGHKSPWKYLYTALVYLSCIPGICALGLVIQMLIFEGQSFLDLSVYMTVLPVASMLFTLMLIKQNVSLDRIPGFDRISAFLLMIFVCVTIFFILSKTRIWAVTYIPFHYFILLFLVLLIVLVFAWRKISR